MLSLSHPIRSPKTNTPLKKQIIHTLLLLLFGVLLGVLSKFLDETPSNLLPSFLQALDLRNFFSRLAIWIFIGVWISVSASSAKRAALNVFVFFLGFASSYYLYSTFIAGFFPQEYAMIWFGLAFVSPLLGFICWFAKGAGLQALVLKAGILAVVFNLTFSYGFVYFYVRYLLELTVFGATIVLLYQNKKETLKAVGLGIVFAILLKVFLPFGF